MSEHGYSEYIHMGPRCAAQYSPPNSDHQLELLFDLVPLSSQRVSSEGKRRREGCEHFDQGEKIRKMSHGNPVISLDASGNDATTSGLSLRDTRCAEVIIFDPAESEMFPEELQAAPAEDRRLRRDETLLAESEACPQSGEAGRLPLISLPHAMPGSCAGGGSASVDGDLISMETRAISKRDCTHQRDKMETLMPLVDDEVSSRKLSDPGARVRREWMMLSKTQRQQRSLSDGQRPNLSMEEYECKSEEGESALGCDSGYHDEVRSKSSKAYNSSVGAFSPPVSDSEGPHETMAMSLKRRRPTPIVPRDDPLNSPSDDAPHPLLSSYKAKRTLNKHHSIGSSIGGASSLGASSSSISTSRSISEILDARSIDVVSDYLACLGFDDFSNPQLVPDRFIPKDVEYAKPSFMRQLTLTNPLDEVLAEPITCLSDPSSPPLPSTVESPPALLRYESMDLPLGATAETFLSPELNHSPPPPPLPLMDSSPAVSLPAVDSAYSARSPLSPFTARAMAVYTDPSISHFDRSQDVLETVPEETASDLSPSPRWHSPRVSIDHSIAELDKVEGKLGTCLAMQMRKRSLPMREGYKTSIGSQVESEPESIYFSVTSYDDEIAREKEKEREEVTTPLSLPGANDDIVLQNRRRRRGVYNAPQGLLTWLNSQQETISEEDIEHENPDDLPWPFSEQMRLRKSLTEIKQAQEASSEQTSQEVFEDACSSPPFGGEEKPEVEVGAVGCSSGLDRDITQLSISSVDPSRPDSPISCPSAPESIELEESSPVPADHRDSTCHHQLKLSVASTEVDVGEFARQTDNRNHLHQLIGTSLSVSPCQSNPLSPATS